MSGVGGASGYSVAEYASQFFKYTAWADADSQAPGLLLNHEHALVLPRAGDTHYIPQLISACRSLGILILSPNVDIEVDVVARNIGLLKDAQLRTWLPSPAVVEICRDKWLFYQWGRDLMPSLFPATWLSPAAIPRDRLAQGIVVKPRIGSGGAGVSTGTTVEVLQSASASLSEPIFQQALQGFEFSADCLSWRNDHSLVHLRRRVSTKAGMSTVTATFHDDVLVQHIQELLSLLEYDGPSCVQGFYTVACEYAITEVNVRFGGGCALAEKSGGGLLSRYFKYLAHNEIDRKPFSYGAGHLLIRPFNTVYAEASQ